jgi:hypothetical protein
MRLVNDDRVELAWESFESACLGEGLHAADDDRRGDVVAVRGHEPGPRARVGSAIAIFSAAWRSNSSRWARTRALPPRRPINAEKHDVLPVPVGSTIRGRRTPRSSARWIAVIASCW